MFKGELKEIWGVRDNSEKESFWTRIGTAYQNRDGSYNLVFNYIPTNQEIKIQMRDRKQKESS